MKRILLLIVLIYSSGLSAQHLISECGGNPEAFTIQQADGSSLSMRVIGNTSLHYTETIDGYTILPNTKGIYEYAERNGDDLMPSGIQAHLADERTSSELDFISITGRHLSYGANKLALMLNNGIMNKQNIGQQSATNATTSIFPSRGTRKVLLILIQYKDTGATYSKTNFSDMMNKHGYNGTNSFADYFKKNSFGALNINTDVFGWYTAKNPPYYYSRAKGDTRSALLVQEAIDAAHKAGVNFSKYDNDGDGNVDGLVVVHSGPGADEQGNDNYIWSHSWYLSSAGGLDRFYNGVTVDHYTIQPETRTLGSTRQVGIGVFCHEFGHAMGLPDYYDTKPGNRSAGVGVYDVMGGGSWLNYERTPASMSAFSKVHFNWVKPKVIITSAAYNLKPSATNPEIFKVNTPVKTEYFLLENKQYIGFDSALPSKGMAIWHIDTTIMNPASQAWYNNYVDTVVNHKGLALLQADGKSDLDYNTNRGDAGDLYPGSSNNIRFDDLSNPNARMYTGAKSGVRIFKITENKDSSVSFNFGPYPSAVFNTKNSEAFLCLNTPLSLVNSSSYADSFKWNFGDGHIDTLKNPSHYYAKSGQYMVKLQAKSSSGADLDSMLITVNPLPNAQFIVSKIDTLSVTVNNTTTGSNFYTWYWGDNISSNKNSKVLTHSYKDTGAYIVSLIVADASNQCTDTLNQIVHILKKTNVGIWGQDLNSLTVKAYPNPFSSSFHIDLNLIKASDIELALYNISGEKLSIIRSGLFAEGKTSVEISGNLSPGIYFIGLSTQGSKPTFIRIVKE
jgi:M6 family metalloprotease-like protein